MLCLIAGCAGGGEARRKIEAPQLPAMASSAGTMNPVPVWLATPPGPGPFPTLVTLHACGGLGSAADQQALERDIQRFTAKGWAVAMPDSFAPRNLRNVCADDGSGAGNPAQRAADAFAVLHWLVENRVAQPDRVILLGRSHGAVTALVVNGMAPPAEYRFAGAVAIYPACLRAPIHPGAAPLLMLLAGKDDWTPPGPCQTYAERLATAGLRAEVQLFPEAYHGFDQPRPAPIRYQGHVMAFDPQVTAQAEARVDTFITSVGR